MNRKATLIAALPIVLILATLAAAIVFFPETKDIRPRASDPTIFNQPTSQPIQKITTPTRACSDLYDPVCGADGLTYDSACEAQIAGIEIDSDSPCTE